MTEQQQQKQRAIDLLESRYRGMENVCEGIDMRLRMYFEDLLEHSSAREDDPNDWHGLYELLGKGCQFMYWGYDKYQSKDPINSLLAFLQSDMNVQKPEMYVQVVSQLNSEFNAPTDDLYAAMFAPVPFISFSPSPLWPWCFGNCVLEIDGRENKRPVKRSQSDSCKVDPVQALIMALDLYERYEGTQH